MRLEDPKDDYVSQEGPEDIAFTKTIGNSLGKETAASPKSLVVTLFAGQGQC